MLIAARLVLTRSCFARTAAPTGMLSRSSEPVCVHT